MSHNSQHSHRVRHMRKLTPEMNLPLQLQCYYIDRRLGEGHCRSIHGIIMADEGARGGTKSRRALNSILILRDRSHALVVAG